MSFDLAVVGSGSAAFAAAIRARELGARVVMAERATLGGTCVNVGCIPSKVLLRATEVYHQAAAHPFEALATRAESADWLGLVAQKDALVHRLRQEKYADLVRDYDWEVVAGDARFEAGPVLRVGGREIRADGWLVATGSSPVVPPVFGLEAAGYLTSTTAMELESLPRSLFVIGAGFIGLELGQVFARLGVRVYLAQRGDRLLSDHEPEVGEVMAEAIDHLGIALLPGTCIERVESLPAGLRVVMLRGGRRETLEVDHVLVATGRRPNTDGLNLESLGVELDGRGAVVVDDTLRTRNPRVWAAGDVTASHQFVYVAAAQGARAAENMLGTPRPVDLGPVPEVIFTHPQIARVGLTEAAARAQGLDVMTSVLPLSAVPRALANHDTLGVIKLVAEREGGRLLGAHVVSENAGDVIYAAVLALAHRLTVSDLEGHLAPYLTMAEGLKLAAQAFHVDIKKRSCCA